MKIGVLTSSRADYGIYAPLLKRLSDDADVDLHIIAFGMHLLPKFGYTLSQIISDKYGYVHIVKGMPEQDDVLSIGNGYGTLIQHFSDFWSKNIFDKLVALGDRFEMSAAIQASIPFEKRIAHLHGGEITLGATDNIYRHQITLASRWHFVSNLEAKKKVIELTGGSERVYNYGALSLDGVDELELPEWSLVAKKFNIPQSPFILITIHPETVSSFSNEKYVSELEHSLTVICKEHFLVITLPNADLSGSLYRRMMNRLKFQYEDRICLVDSFGRMNYFAAMKASSMLLGNTSSGILEAASFGKYVINIGDRQKGRLQSENVINVPFNSNAIINAVNQVSFQNNYSGDNIYFQSNTSFKIYKTLIDDRN